MTTICRRGTVGPGRVPTFVIHTRFTVEALKVISREASANVV